MQKFAAGAAGWMSPSGATRTSGRAASALGQHAHGVIDVYDSGVRLEVTLPWLLARFAHAVQRVVGQKGMVLLEKK